ncbi:valine--tRNA ligase [Robiginitomaculum antarcticum]|uniref:valine--tRNA ligase n=1 Tax=Robiginitomaculum antarcticum TaxID=437507 RepID=UPI000380AB90|nr:valine--tRNA ligase [Robiginitomaculum antarcticum]
MLDKAFAPKTAEPRLYQIWEDSGAFKPRMDTSREAFSIVIPPPNVTGNLHMGHAVNNTLQDILIRYNRMLGKDVLWQPGTDHAGIATQMVVERKLAAQGKARKDMSRDEFLEHVWAWKAESGGNITQQLRRLGASCDWSRERFTLGNPEDKSDKMAEAVTKAFVDMYNDGLIYRDKRLVNWDPHFQTAISDLEVENIEKDGFFWHFKYPLDGDQTYTYVEKDEDGNITLSEERDYISIATTRPETMLGDGAVAVHPDDERYAPIIGKMVRLPLSHRLIPIITDEYPDMDFGSGAVKITGAHDFNDYDVAKRNNIPMYSLMGTRGEMIESEIMPAKYVGMDRFVARKAVVADIDAEGLLIRVEDKKVMQPFGDRSGVVIEPMLTDQWFVDAEKLAVDAQKAVDDGRTKFVPENWKKTYDHWMNNIQPWCISRQLLWGHQIPAWYGPEVKSVENLKRSSADIFLGGSGSDVIHSDLPIFVGKDEFTILEMAKEFYGKDVEVRLSNDQPSYVRCGISGDNEGLKKYVELARDPDVLDTWFSSGLWPFSTMGWPDKTDELARFYPGSVLITAFDIIFFWVARMMMQGLYFMKDVPFKDVYIHALVLDEQGKKMSKSVGNTLDPLDLIDGVTIDELVAKRTRGLKDPRKAPQIEKSTRKQYPDGFEPYGADALRFTLAAMAGQGRNIRLSVERIAGYRNFGTKLWSAATFGQMNGCVPQVGFDPAEVTLTLNNWIISETVKTTKEVSRCIEAYRFNDASDAIYKFAWDTFCSWYLELSKPILSRDAGAAKTETQATFAWVLDQILKLLHPFMPFITEELWSEITKDRDTMLIMASWPKLSNDLIDKKAVKELDWLQTLITNIRSVRADMNIPPSKKAPLLMLSGKLDPRLSVYAPQLSPMARVERVELAASAPQAALQTVVDGVTFAIPLEGLVDFDAERARMDKEIAKIEGELSKIDRKLSNEGFLAKAPDAVVAEQKSRKAAYAAEMESLISARDALPR